MLAGLLALAGLALAGAADAYTVRIEITGAGAVTASGISCQSSLATPQGDLGQTGDCFEDYGIGFTPPVLLTAAPHAGSASLGWSFSGWSSCANPNGAVCLQGGFFDPNNYVVRARFADTIAPTIVLASGPQAGSIVASTAATFSLGTNDGTASFRCSVDANPPTLACSSTVTFSGLAQGPHTFRARAIDPTGHASPIVERTWVVDTMAPPVPSILAGPAGHVSRSSATFAFSAPEAGVQFECRIEPATFAPCTSPRAITGLAEGEQTFSVRSRDAVGNLSAPASRSWIVDTIAPSAPSVFQIGPPSRSGFRIGWSAATDANGVTGYAVLLNGEPVEIVPSDTVGYLFSGLVCGLSYGPAIEAIDEAGNRSARTSASISTAACPPVPKCHVPKLKGKTVAQAKTLLAAKKCKLGTVKRAFSRTVRKGLIIKQAPLAGTVKPANTKVNLTVSKGKP